MKIQNALVLNIPNRSQRYFAHVTTVTLSWRVQNIVVIGRVYFTLECFEFSSNFEFDRNMLSGTGAWSGQMIKPHNSLNSMLRFVFWGCITINTVLTHTRPRDMARSRPPFWILSFAAWKWVNMDGNWRNFDGNISSCVIRAMPADGLAP